MSFNAINDKDREKIHFCRCVCKMPVCSPYSETLCPFNIKYGKNGDAKTFMQRECGIVDKPIDYGNLRNKMLPSYKKKMEAKNGAT